MDVLCGFCNTSFSCVPTSIKDNWDKENKLCSAVPLWDLLSYCFQPEKESKLKLEILFIFYTLFLSQILWKDW